MPFTAQRIMKLPSAEWHSVEAVSAEFHTHIGPEIPKGIQIHLQPSVKYECHPADYHDIQA